MKINTQGSLFIITIISCLFSFRQSYAQANSKIKGISFVASSSPIFEKDVTPVVQVNANWVTLMPYGYVGKDGTVQFNKEWQWWGETVDGLEKTIALCRKSNLKIMIKPQIWFHDKYTGDFELETDKKWEKFENSYRDFIFTFLKVAVQEDVALFCVGTEWREFVAQRPQFWKSLIAYSKKVYKGKLTYAANWDDYVDFPFWDDLDYIGVNGYFPISISAEPELKELILGWEKHEKVLSDFSKKWNRQIIFTEIGYRSMVGATIKPWEHNTRNKYSAEIQSRAYKALFHVLWKKPWFKGVFLWKWFHNHENSGGKGDVDFTPQNKLAEKTIREFWKN